MRMAALVRNWWMMAARGVFAMAFGAVLSLWPSVTLPVVVVLFAAYAVLDGAWAIGAAVWAAERGRRWDAWPVALYVVAFWGLVTGGLELLTALAVPRHRALHWIMGTAAAASLFLAALVMLVPLADAASGVALIAAYAIISGVLMISAAVRFRDAHTTAVTMERRAVISSRPNPVRRSS